MSWEDTNRFTGGKMMLVGEGKSRPADAPFPIHPQGSSQEAYLTVFGTRHPVNVLMAENMVAVTSDTTQAWLNADLSAAISAGDVRALISASGTLTAGAQDGPQLVLQKSGKAMITGPGVPEVSVMGDGAISRAGTNQVTIFADGSVKAGAKNGNYFGLTPGGEVMVRSGDRAVMVTLDGAIVVTENGEIVGRFDAQERVAS